MLRIRKLLNSCHKVTALLGLGLALTVLLVGVASLSWLDGLSGSLVSRSEAASTPLSPPAVPSSFYGTLTQGGSAVPAGSIVSAWKGSTKIAESAAFAYGADTVYRLHVPADDPITSQVEGGREGQTIVFQISGLNSNVAPWQAGSYSRLDIVVGPDADSDGWSAAVDCSETDSTVHPGQYEIANNGKDDDCDLSTLDGGSPPVADFIFTSSLPLAGDSVQFIDASTDANGPIASWAWDFEGDGVTDSALQNPSFIYTAPGSYTVTLSVTDGQGQNASASKALRVARAPVAAFTYTPSQAQPGTTVQFTDGSTDDGTVVGWMWEFGDGTTSAQANPTHVFSAAGAFAVRLTVTDDEGLVDSATQTIVVVGPPAAAFTVSKGMNVAQLEDGAVVVAASSQFSPSYRPANAIDGNAGSYWSTANGQPTNQWMIVQLAGSGAQIIDRVALRGASTSQGLKGFDVRVSTTGTADGDFTTVLSGSVPQDDSYHEFAFAPVRARYVRLSVIDNWTNATFTTVYGFQVWTPDRQGGLVSLNEGPPASIAGFSSQRGIGYEPEKAIDAQSSSAWFSASGQTANQWLKVRLGGGEEYTIDRVRLQSSASYPSDTVRDFEVRVSTTTADDAAFTTVFAGTAAAGAALQEFAFAPVQARYVQLYVANKYGSLSSINVATFQALTPDGANAARLEGVGAFIVGYSSQGSSANAAERAIDFDSGSSWVSASGQVTNQWIKLLLMRGGPYLIDRVRLQGSNTAFSARDFEVRVSTTTADDAAFTTVLTGALPRDSAPHWFSFAPVQAKYVQLVLLNNHGDANSLRLDDFKVFSPQRGPLTVPFLDLSEPAENAIAWNWDFGDGTTSTERYPTHTYAAPGMYTVNMTVTSVGGLTDTATMSYTALAPVTANFTWSPSSPLEGQNTSFVDASSSPSGVIVGWNWQYPGNTSTSSSLSTTFPDNGPYSVALSVTDNNLLTGSITRTVDVLNAAPTVGLTDRTVTWSDPIIVTPSVNEPGATDRATLSYLWDLGNGATATLSSLNYTYPAVGTYTVRLTVTDKDGGSGTDTATYTVNKRATTLIYAGDRSAQPGQPVRLRAKLRDNLTGKGISGKTIEFTLAGSQYSATTGADGFAEVSPVYGGAGGISSVIATFAGDATHLGGSDSKPFAVAGLFPSSLNVTLAAGQTITEAKQAILPRSFKLADVVLAFDTTGSMSGVIDTAQAQGAEIVHDLGGLIQDGRYAIAYHGDYTTTYSSFGYTAGYGGVNDTPYDLLQPLTSDIALVVQAIDGIRMTAGGDGPESYTRVMYESVAELLGDTNPVEGPLGYRAGSRRILVMFNDSVPHDNNLNDAVPGKTGIYSTGGDPGRNGIMDETSDPSRIGPPHNDDLDLQRVLAQLAANNVTLIPVRLTSNRLEYWQHWAGLTGGSAIQINSGPVAVSDAVREAIENAASRIDKVILRPSAGFESWVQVSPSEYQNVSTPVALDFQVRITPPIGTPPGTYNFTIDAIGDGATYAAQTVSVTVSADVNQPPTLAPIDDQTVDEGSLLSVALSANDPDIPANALTFSLESGAPMGATVNPATGIFAWTPSEQQGPGVYPVTVKVTDDGSPSLSATQTFTITVGEVNSAPVIDQIADQTISEGALLTFTASASDFDSPANTLTFGLLNGPAGASIDSSTGVFTWMPSEIQGPGVFTFTVNVSDNGAPSLFASTVFSVTVNEANQAPVLAPIGNKTVMEGSLLTFTVVATDTDQPANTLTFSLTGTVPSGAAINSSTGAFTWTPSEAQGPAQYTFGVRVTDNGSPSLYAEEQITVTVQQANQAPALSPISNKSAAWGETVVFTATATDPDMTANALTFDLVDAPAGASINSASGLFSWTPMSGQMGVHAFTVRVTDDGSPALSASRMVSVTVGKRPTVVTNDGVASAQYSDPVTVTAQLKDNGPGTLQGSALENKSLQFDLGGKSIASNTGATGVATATIALDQPAGAINLKTSFAGDSLFLASEDADVFEVAKENVTLEYTGNTFVSTTNGQSSSTATVNLIATLQEESDGSLGDKLNTTQVKFSIFRWTDEAMMNPVGVYTATVQPSGSGSGIATSTTSLTTDNYVIKVELATNPFYAAPFDLKELTVAQDGEGFVTGGGWLNEPTLSTRGNFGFTVKYLKNGRVQGNSLYTYRVKADIGQGLRDYDIIIKSNAMSGLSQQCSSATPAICTASFTGKANIKAVDGVTGATHELGGNYYFQVDVTDNGEPGSGASAMPDRYAIRVWNDLEAFYTLGTYAGTKNTSQAPLAGGNIQAHTNKGGNGKK